MGLFLSTVTNRVDSKGRTSVPARFRASLAEQGATGIVCFASFTLACIEAMTLEKATEIAERLDGEFNPFDDEGDAFAQSILASCVELPFDREGRIMLPDDLCGHAGIGAQATFVGLGRRFQIWEPEGYAAYAQDARSLARDRRARFGARRPGPEEPGPKEPGKAAIPAGQDGRGRVAGPTRSGGGRSS